MTSAIAKASLIPAVAWLLGTAVIRYLRHGAIVREDLIDAAILGAVVAAAGFVIELVQSKRRRKPPEFRVP
jgi:hypothetical protein